MTVDLFFEVIRVINEVFHALVCHICVIASYKLTEIARYMETIEVFFKHKSDPVFASARFLKVENFDIPIIGKLGHMILEAFFLSYKVNHLAPPIYFRS